MCGTDVSSQRDVLPVGLKPIHYDLKLTDIDADNLTFVGHVDIEYKVIQDSTAIYLNTADLDLKSAFVIVGDTTISVTAIKYDATTQVSTLELAEPIEETESSVYVSIDYTGVIQSDMSGFYLSKYKDIDGKDKIMLSTQFEATDARKAFPCADEPSLKATFDVTIAVSDPSWTVLGNMSVASSITENGITTVKFDRTPIMSTYLLAWAIGELDYVESFTEREYNGKKVPVRVYTTKGRSKEGQLALDTATKIIDYFSTIFEIDYMLPKCDLIAVPEFAAGAMENWGLITYSTTALLYDEATSDSSFRVWVLEVVAHELAHQWFGNLVTMSWWNELWLNEGYATYASWLAVDHLYPELQVFSKFVTDDLQGALGLDSLRTSHPIDVPVKSALDVDQIFDNISYLKGASVIRMISTQLGDDVFIKGVSNYLKKHSYGNSTTIDLWDALSEASGTDVNAAIGIWTLKIGFPLVTVTEKDNGEVILRQDRFLGSGDVKDEENQTIWWIPLSISSGAEPSSICSDVPSILNSREIVIPDLANCDFFLLNKNQTGVYRVKYSQERLEKITSNIHKLSLNDKIGLLADSAATASAGVSKTDSILTVILSYKEEANYNLWSEILSQYSSLKNKAFEQPEETIHGLEAFIRDVISINLEKLGWEFAEGDDYLTVELRSSLIATAIANGHTEAIELGKKKFFAWKNGDKKAIHPSIRKAVFHAAIANTKGDELKEVYDTILNEFENPSTVDSKVIALSSLGRVKDIHYIDHSLTIILSGAIPAQDIYVLLGSISLNPLGRWRAWEFVKTNWEAIFTSFGSNLSSFNNILRSVLTRFSSQAAYDDIETFFKTKDTKGFERIIEQSLDITKTSAQWIGRDAGVIRTWLEEHKYVNSA